MVYSKSRQKQGSLTFSTENAEPRPATFNLQVSDTALAGPILFQFRLKTRK